jgi:hypothetical protein
MGRDYIGERTIADPRLRAAEKARRRRQAAQRRAAEAAALARYKERTRWCAVPGCGQPRSGGESGFWPCCSQACLQRWEAELERRDEVALARRQGLPVAALRTGPAPGATVTADPAPPRRYALIACSGSKAAAAAPAAQLYQGDLFRKSLAWAQRQGCAEVAILSARHGLLPLDQVVAPYDERLVQATLPQRRRWAERVLAQLLQRWPLGEACELVFLAGRRYAEPLVELIHAAAPHTQIRRPLAGRGIGSQKGWLARQLRGPADPSAPPTP